LADVTVKRLDEFEAIFHGAFRRVRAGLGVTSFGIAVIDLPPSFGGYPEHDQSHDSQEEVYTLLDGAAALHVGGEEIAMEPGVWVRVGPEEKRKFVTSDSSARILAMGGTPGAVYGPPEFSEEGGSADELKGAKAAELRS
jgi:uncharacterized cupin superfamily protein